MSAGKGRPIHFTDRELNKKPSPYEPTKSYEDRFLDDEDLYSFSEAERYHRERGDMYSYEPHPSSLGSNAAAAAVGRAGGTVSRRRERNHCASTPGTASAKPSAVGGKEDTPSTTSEAPNDPSPPLQFQSPASSCKRSDSFRKKLQSFDDNDTLQEEWIAAGHRRGDSNNREGECIPRSPTSWPSFTSMAKAKRGDRNESHTSAISTLTDDGLEGDSFDYLSYSGDKKAPGGTRKPGRYHGVEDSELSRMFSTSSIRGSESTRSQGKPHAKGTSKSNRKQAKWDAKKRQRARDIRLNALSGSHEFGHDIYGIHSGREDLEDEAEVSSLGNDRYDSLRGKRAERVHSELHLAKTSKKLFLKDLNLTAKELPTQVMCSSPLGGELHKMCLAGNHLKHLPDMLAQNLIGLRTLDLQQCKLVALPDLWDLPNLRRLNLSHNLLKTFFIKGALQGLPKLEHLNMSNNEICEVSFPDGCDFLEYLNLSFNDISHIPEDLLRLQKLKVLRISNNYLSHVPENVCHMPLSELDVTPNPLIQPPTGDCERGIQAMRRYYVGLQRRRARKVEKKGSWRQRHGGDSAISDDGLGDDFGTGPFGSVSNEVSTLYAEAPVDAIEKESYNKTAKKSKKKSKRKAARSRVREEIEASMGFDEVSRSRDGPPQRDSLRDSFTGERRRGMVAMAHAMMATEKFTIEPDHKTFVSDVPYSTDSVRPQDMIGDAFAAEVEDDEVPIKDTINDTLKIIFVGKSCSGKTTLMHRLKYGSLAKVPKLEERTIGVNIDEWKPKDDCSKYEIPMQFDTQVVQEGASRSDQDTDIRFSCWDFAGQDVYHATHEIFFSNASLYVVVWDMAAKNPSCDDVQRRSKLDVMDDDPYQWVDSSDEEDNDHISEEASRKAERALEHDIDEKVQYWVDCIRACVPGAAILPVATFDDCFDKLGGAEEAKRRCNKMKERLLNKEQLRISSLRKRLEKLESGNRANTAAAMRLKELLSPYRRPKLIFGDGRNSESVLRVSGESNTGFDELRRKIIHIATGKDTAGMNCPLFRGHVGSTIPPLRMKIRDLIREKRTSFQVVEWGHFLTMLEKSLDCLLDAGQISDALRFLSRVGEISYFGDCDAVQDRPHYTPSELLDDSSDDEDDGDGYVAVSDNRRDAGTLPAECGARDDDVAQESNRVKMSGLSQFIFLNPMWLAATLRCILRHDLRQQLDDILQEKEENIKATTRWDSIGRGDSFHDAAVRCPVITAKQARMLWEAKSKIAKSARRATLDTTTPKLSAFDFMQGLLVHFGVFVPIDLDIDNVLLDGEHYSLQGDESESRALSIVFFLPSQLKPWEGPADEMWTYKSKDAVKTCLCQTWLFPDGAPPGLMERLTASVLRTLYDATSCYGATDPNTCIDKDRRLHEKGNGQLSFRRILCWKTAFKIVLAKSFVDVDGESSETSVEIWSQLEDQGSPFCVAGEATGVGMKRLIISAKGQEGNWSRSIWEGGYDLVLKAADRVIKEYRGLDFTKQGVCPKCLESRNLRDVSMWKWTRVQDAVKDSGQLCCENGHDIDVRYVAGRTHVPDKVLFESEQNSLPSSFVPYSELCAGVVLVGLWDGDRSYVCRAGTGFVVDRRHGLIVTAAHNVIDMNGANVPIGSWKRSKSRYYGLEKGRAVIGVIPGNTGEQHAGESLVGPEAYFRYFADIVAEDICNMDACVLRVTGRIQNDVGGSVHECGMQPISALRGRDEIEKEGLHQLAVSGRCELEEQVRLLGYTQGGEGIVPPGQSLNRVLEVVKGDVVKKYKADEFYLGYHVIGHVPRYEIVINCPLTIFGQSGCPCVSQSGQVIGILSRADPADKQRCYLVPTREFMELVRIAKSWED